MMESKKLDKHDYNWDWHIFGRTPEGYDYAFVGGVRRPPLWKRLILRFFLGSTWIRISQDELERTWTYANRNKSE